jgi:hypothetical protein
MDATLKLKDTIINQANGLIVQTLRLNSAPFLLYFSLLRKSLKFSYYKMSFRLNTCRSENQHHMEILKKELQIVLRNSQVKFLQQIKFECGKSQPKTTFLVI